MDEGVTGAMRRGVEPVMTYDDGCVKLGRTIRKPLIRAEGVGFEPTMGVTP
jgi:hypothetical protein